MTNPNSYQLQVTKKYAGIRLDKFLAVKLPEISRSMVKKLVEANHVFKGDKIIADCSFNIKEGDMFVVNMPPPSKSEMLPANIPLNIVYEDTEFLVINKPAGLTVHPGAGQHNDTLANALLAHCGESLSGIGGVMRPGIVHRIDKDTSGLIMAAKTDRAHHGLSSQISTHSLKRAYLAICWGVPKPLTARVCGNIGRSVKNRKKMSVVGSGGKAAATNYSVLEILGEGIASLVECRLETGRTHQIRVHMTHIGHPLIGDQAYCGRRSGTVKSLSDEAREYLAEFKRQALHSHKLVLNHPITGEEMEFVSGLPDDMKKLLDVLREGN